MFQEMMPMSQGGGGINVAAGTFEITSAGTNTTIQTGKANIKRFVMIGKQFDSGNKCLVGWDADWNSGGTLYASANCYSTGAYGGMKTLDTANTWAIEVVSVNQATGDVVVMTPTGHSSFETASGYWYAE